MYEDTRKVKMGFCSVGHHEGMRVPGPSGRFNKTCLFIETCACDAENCHQFYDRMFEASGLDRVPVDNSGYVPEKVDYILAHPVPLVVPMQPILSSERVALPSGTLESAAPGTLPPLMRHDGPTETATGRTARGTLEDWVNEVCITWSIMSEKGGEPCSPSFVSKEIAKEQGISPPSTGAVDSVFNRFVAWEYAVVEKKPTRFTGFTLPGIKMGMDEMKRRYKSRGNTR